MRRRDFLARASLAAVGIAGGFRPGPGLLVSPSYRSGGFSQSTLHNGIILPEIFPPELSDPLSTEEIPYYLESPPDPIIIDIGRQLFVDDFLIDSSEGLSRTYHQPEPHPGNPVLSPTESEFTERTGSDGILVRTFFAAPYSDGVWWDTYQKCFRAWFLSGRNFLKLAESDDGIHWHRATLPNGSEILMEVPPFRDSGTVQIDYDAQNPSERYKMSYFSQQDKKNWLYTSEDGLIWPDYWNPNATTAGYTGKPDVPVGDRTTFFYDPFRKKSVWSLRDVIDMRNLGGVQFNRLRRYVETDDLIADPEAPARNTLWLKQAPDDSTPRPPQVYNLDGSPYESLMIFMMAIWTGPASLDSDNDEAISKTNRVHLGFSRDGFHVSRPPMEGREPFLAEGAPGTWNEGNIQSVGGGFIVVGPEENEELYVYFSGRENRLVNDSLLERTGCMGLASLRRDGFASLDAGPDEAVLTTRVLQFSHESGFLFVNADSSGGFLQAEILDESGTVIGQLSRERSVAFSSDKTKHAMTWSGGSDLSHLSGRRFRIRFYLASCKLFSFWVSPNVTGTSEGYIGAGGPDYSRYRDDVVTRPSSGSPDAVPTADFALIGSYPNPFRTVATIEYRLDSGRHVDLAVFDLVGRQVAHLVNRELPAGSYSATLDGGELPAGVYVCRLLSGNRESTLKVTRQR